MARPSPDPLFILRGSECPITSLKYIAREDGMSLLASGNQDGKISLWDLKINRTVHQLDGHPGDSVLWLGWVSATSTLLSQGRDGVVHMWKSSGEDWNLLGSLKCGALGFCGGNISGDELQVAVPSSTSSQIDIIDLQSECEIQNLNPTQEETTVKYGMCMCITFPHGNKNQLLVGYENGSILLWDTKDSKIIHCISPHESPVMCMAFSEKYQRGISGSSNNKLCVWKLNASDQSLSMYKEIEVTNNGFNSIVVRHDSKIFATAGWDANIRIFSTKTLKQLAVLSYHNASIQALVFSEDFILAAGSKDGRISLWDVYL